MSSRFRTNDGDWTCPDQSCGNVNFARRDACNRCGKPKEESRPKVKKLGMEIGKDAAEKSKGLFSADDWMCTKCGNVNWARRTTCNVCNAPRFGEVEERTGYGGGYNERENVEYKERNDSEDEFDEFGRIKKKYRKSDAKKTESQPSTSASKSENEDEDDEDDDDDDDDDGDLSKYDLSGWGDENVPDQKNSAVTKNDISSSRKLEKRSRSRSRDRKRSRSSSRSRSCSRRRSRSRSRSRSSRSRSRSRNNYSGKRDDRHRRRSRTSSNSSRSRSRSRSRTRDRRRRR